MIWLARCRPDIGATVPVEHARSEEHVEKLTADLQRKMGSVLSTPQLLECRRTPITFHKESLQMISL